MNKQIILFIIALFLHAFAMGQNTKPAAKTKEVKINYKNGLDVFNVYVSNPNIKYYDSIEYTWFTEYSKIKSTKGGTGGLLLHGVYKFYDQYGNLRVERNYSNGRLNGIVKYWDSLGSITSHYRYLMGKCVYQKFKNEENHWVEFNGPIFEKGTIRKIYSEYNTLIEIDTQYSFSDKSVTLFYNDGRIKKSYFQINMWDTYNGVYISYWENGKLKEKGQYWDSAFMLDIKVGKWTYYNADGTKITRIYKRGTEYWDNGVLKAEGTLCLYKTKNEWFKDETWQYYNTEGELDYQYEYGIAVAYPEE